MKIPDTNKIIGIAYLIGIVIVLFIVYKLMVATGLIKTAAAKKAKALKEEATNTLRTDQVFNPDYYKTKKFKSLGSNAALKYAKDLREAVRPSLLTLGLGTDEELIYVTFGKFYNKCNISEVAEAYYSKYKSDLQSDLLNELTDKEAVPLFQIINNLPDA